METEVIDDDEIHSIHKMLVAELQKHRTEETSSVRVLDQVESVE